MQRINSTNNDNSINECQEGWCSGTPTWKTCSNNVCTEAPFTGTVKHNTETMNTLKGEGGDGVVVVTENLPPIMSKPLEVGQDAGEVANPSDFIASMNKMNDYMKTTPEVLGMTL